MSLFDEDEKALQQRAVALIKPLIPANAEDRVGRAYKQFNQIVRKHIRAETGLGLLDEDGRGNVVVRIVDGFPIAVATLIDRNQDPTLWRLILALPKLAGAVEGLDLLVKHWDEFEQWAALPQVAKASYPALTQSLDVAKALRQLAAAKKVFEELKLINEDILGVYRFGSFYAPRVEIFWMAHALFAGAFGLRIEDLTVVTLAHELSHAYSHLGRDIDGATWSGAGFGESDLAVIEGLAQFYTTAVVRKLAIRAPGVTIAFNELLQHQSEVYHTHEGWLEDSPAERGESVRFAMLRARSRGKVTIEDWLQMLIHTKDTLIAKD